MAGTGRVPKPPSERVNRAKPSRGEWQAAPGLGWQHGAIPAPPARLLRQTREAWETWMQSWFGAHWTPDDLPGLRHVALLYDAVQRGELRAAAELRQMMDNYGITPKGQQDRRWLRPKPTDEVPGRKPRAQEEVPVPYVGLDLVN